MKLRITLICFLSLARTLFSEEEQLLNLGSSISRGDASVPYTAEELAIPPVGEIQKLYLREVNQLRTGLAAYLSTVPAGAGGQASPWFAKFQAYKAGLDQLAASRLQTDTFVQVDKMEEVFLGKANADFPDFGVRGSGWMKGLSSTLLHAIGRHISDQNGTVSSSNFLKFVKVFSTSGFVSAGDWEESPIPVDSAGIMVLDPASVVTHLTSLPWQRAAAFLGGMTAEKAFLRYESAGNGHAVLKTRYAANKAAIVAKWKELAGWVDQQNGP